MCFKNWSFQKISITKNVPLNWYSSMKKKLRKIRIIFDIENWLWKSGIGNFRSLDLEWVLIYQEIYHSCYARNVPYMLSNVYVFYNAWVFFCHLFYVNWKMKLLFKVSKHNAFRLMQKCIIHMRSPIIITIDFIVRVLYTFIVAINFAQNNDLHTWNFLTFAQWWPEIPKGGFFQKVRCFFQISKTNIPNHYPELKIWIVLYCYGREIQTSSSG